MSRRHQTPRRYELDGRDVLALRYREGRDYELWLFVGDRLVFDGPYWAARPAVLSPLGLERPLFDQMINPGDYVVQTEDGFEVIPAEDWQGVDRAA